MTAHARVVFPVVLVLILGLASTSLLVRLGAADQGTQPKAQTSRRAYDLLAQGFGPGFNGPIPIVVDVNGDRGAPQRIRDRVEGLPGVASVGAPQFNDRKTVAIVFVKPDAAPQDEATSKLVDRLRDDVVPAATAGGNGVAYVLGGTGALDKITVGTGQNVVLGDDGYIDWVGAELNPEHFTWAGADHDATDLDLIASTSPADRLRFGMRTSRYLLASAVATGSFFARSTSGRSV